MKDVKALRTLVGVREREGKRIEDRLNVERGELKDRQAKAEEAASGVSNAEAAEQAKRDERLQIISNAFTPHALRAVDYAIEDRVKEVAEAIKVANAAEAAVQSQQQVITEVQDALRRNEQRMEKFKERIEKSIKDRDQAIEDSTDEESEETAASRYVARRRKEAAERHG